MTVPFFQPWLTLWRLSVEGPPFQTHIGSRLMPVSYEGRPAILKIADSEEEKRGGALMEWYDGDRAAKVFERQDYALLLERATGTRSLAEMARQGQDDEATRILCRAAMALHGPRRRTLPPDLVPLERWFEALWRASATHGGLFKTSESAACALLAEPRALDVLHGDLHHDNLLDGGERGWLAIDPKGLFGERDFEYANLFRNPDETTALAPGRMRRRAMIVADEAALEVPRLLQWVIAYAGLGSAWRVQNGGDPGPGLRLAELAAAELAN